MNICTLEEDEQKFLIKSVNKKDVWDKEFIIYQWYEDISKDGYESKLKLIVDMLNFTKKLVRVEKERKQFLSSHKTIYYLNIDEFNPFSLLKKPFIAKRRSIKNDFHLDFFLHSNNKCKYMLEVENTKNDDFIDFSKISEIEISKKVTLDFTYLNKNLAIEFSDENLLELNCMLRYYND